MSIRDVDMKYLNRTVGPALQEGVKETLVIHPDDPVGYLSSWLQNWVEGQARAQKVKEEIAAEARREKEAREVRVTFSTLFIVGW
eukprot:1350203-Pyramimonas_sp.AAC.2